jgi:hypothetical protein
MLCGHCRSYHHLDNMLTLTKPSPSALSRSSPAHAFRSLPKKKLSVLVIYADHDFETNRRHRSQRAGGMKEENFTTRGSRR